MLELQFLKESISCLKPAVRDVQNIEQTQELRLSDGMPDIGRILSAWGQVILRGKEWLEDSISLTGGVMVWLLYIPEEGGAPVSMDTWVPFQLRWDLPVGTPEGTIRTECLMRFVDARSVSARKIMLRCGIAALAEAYVSESCDVYSPQKLPEDIQLLQMTYPLQLPVDAGEKTFLLDEEISLPASVPEPEKLIYYRITPVISDQKVMANKVVFRGVGMVHLLYACKDGQLHSWDMELPFSQFAELEQSFSAEAEADLLISTTSLELEHNEESGLRLKCGFVGQYLIKELQHLSLVEDAYSTTRELECQEEMLQLPMVLETRRERIAAEQNLPVAADKVTDIQYLPDFPRQRQTDDKVHLELRGYFQMLYYDDAGNLQSANTRWEGTMNIPSHPDSRLFTLPVNSSNPQALPGAGSVTMRAETEVSLNVTSTQGLSMVTGLELGEGKNMDENRPSLILRRAGDIGLWDMAKMSGSTMDAIRQANNMEGEPTPGQMLLIPIP